MNVQPTYYYRQYEDVRATIDAYLRAKSEGARDLALNIRRANPVLEVEFDSIDKKLVLLPVLEEGWDN